MMHTKARRSRAESVGRHGSVKSENTAANGTGRLVGILLATCGVYFSRGKIQENLQDSTARNRSRTEYRESRVGLD